MNMSWFDVTSYKTCCYYESNYGLVGSKSTFICGVEKYVENCEFLNLKISQFDQAEFDYDREL